MVHLAFNVYPPYLCHWCMQALVKLPWVPESEYIKAIEDSENKDNQTDSHSQDKDVYSLLEGT